MIEYFNYRNIESMLVGIIAEAITYASHKEMIIARGATYHEKHSLPSASYFFIALRAILNPIEMAHIATRAIISIPNLFEPMIRATISITTIANV